MEKNTTHLLVHATRNNPPGWTRAACQQEPLLIPEIRKIAEKSVPGNPRNSPSFFKAPGKTQSFIISYGNSTHENKLRMVRSALRYKELKQGDTILIPQEEENHETDKAIGVILQGTGIKHKMLPPCRNN